MNIFEAEVSNPRQSFNFALAQILLVCFGDFRVFGTIEKNSMKIPNFPEKLEQYCEIEKLNVAPVCGCILPITSCFTVSSINLTLGVMTRFLPIFGGLSLLAFLGSLLIPKYSLKAGVTSFGQSRSTVLRIVSALTLCL